MKLDVFSAAVLSQAIVSWTLLSLESFHVYHARVERKQQPGIMWERRYLQ